MLVTDYPLTAICRVLGLPRSSWYYAPQGAAETELKAAINQIAAHFPTYGSRRVMHQLRRRPVPGAPAGRRRVRRLMRELGLVRRRKPTTRRTTNSEHHFPRFENLLAGLIDDVYQTKRIHSALGYLTPSEFAARWAAAG